MKPLNLFSDIPNQIPNEIFEDIVSTKDLRIERIISKGHTSPDSGWYDQDEHEWVIVLQGAGAITFENGEELRLKPGDYINIPKHKKHKVSWTDPDEVTLWLAIFYH